MGKRRRDQEKERKKKERAARRARKRREGPSEIPVSDVEEVTGDLDVVERKVKARRAAQPAGAKAIPSRLFVGSLSWGVDDNELREAFEKFGPVTEAVVVCDRDTGKSRGFGFVVMEDRKDAAKAIDELDGSELDGRQIVVNLATERKRS